MTENLCYTPAIELASRIRRGDLSPVEVVETFLSRIKERDKEINAFVHIAEDRAREAARKAEKAVESGENLGALHGVPVAIKDLNDVGGMPTTNGSVPLANNIPEDSEPLVARLEDAGGIILGKTNTPEFGHKGTTDNPLFGPTSTPFAPGRNAGGSSGGSAAAIADGLVPLAQGSDGGGSIRIPSAFSGCYGIKPTWRRIPRRYEPDAFSHTPFSDVGPHTRTVEDAALMLSVMVGQHPIDPMVAPDDGINYLQATRESIDGLSVAYSADFDVFPVDERVASIVDDAAYAFQEANAEVEEVSMEFDHSRDTILASWMAGFKVGYAETAKNLNESKGIDYLGEHRKEATPDFVELIEAGQDYSAVEYKRADIVRTDVFRAIQSILDEYDVLVAPTVAIPPVKNDAARDTIGPKEVAGESVNPLVGWCLTYPINMTGHPAANVPAGFTDDGLPVGMQIIGRRFEDDTVLAASAAFERVRPWRDAYPPR